MPELEPFKTASFPVKSYTAGRQVVGIEAFAADYVEPGRVGLIRITLDDEWLGLVTGDWAGDDDAGMLANALRFLGSYGHKLYAV